MSRLCAVLVLAGAACGFDPDSVAVKDAVAGDAMIGADAVLVADAPDDGPDGDGDVDGDVDGEPDATVDAPVPDAPVTADAPPPDARRTCRQIYGDVSGFVFCTQTTSECSFSADLAPDCASACASAGGVCLRAYTNPNSTGNECNIGGAIACADTSQTTNVCVCSRP